MNYTEFIDRITVAFHDAVSEEIETEDPSEDDLSLTLDKNIVEILYLIKYNFNLPSRESAIRLILNSGINALRHYVSLFEDQTKDEPNLDIDLSDLS